MRRLMRVSRARSPLTPDDERESSVDGLDIQELFRRYAPNVASMGFAILGSRDEVDDMVQDVFIRAWRGMKKLEHSGAVKSWLMTIAVRVAHTRLARRRFTRLFLPPGEINIEEIAAPETSPEERLTLQRLYRILQKMPVDLRIAWVLRHVQNETVEEIARLCGWSRSTTKRRVAAADEYVSKKLSR